MGTEIPKPTKSTARTDFREDAHHRRARYKAEHMQCEFYDAILDKNGKLLRRRRCSGDTEDLAHLRHRKMGGTRNPEIEDEANYMGACRHHHDIYDGMIRRWEDV